MNLRGITVSVNYADLLERSLERWHIGLDRLVVVTSSADEATQQLCCRYNVETHVTDIFYANEARFNKGAALSEAILAKGLRDGADWLLGFDADIVPPEDWRVQVERRKPEPSKLYGAYRYWQPETQPKLIVDYTKRMPQSWVLGFFTLFHANDSCLPGLNEPLFDVCWPHAGCFDTLFARRWEKQNQVILPIPMVHLGEERQNWCGRGDPGALRAILNQRRGHEDWEKERMTNPPVLNIPYVKSSS